MINGIERGHLINKVQQLLEHSKQLELTAEQRLADYERATELLIMLQRTTRSVGWFRDKYPTLKFIETPNYTEVTHPRISTFTRAEAIDLRNALKAEGLDNFRVTYAAYAAFVEDSPETNESVAIEQIVAEYNEHWKVFRSPSNDTVNLVSKTAYSTDEATLLANNLGNKLKERYPYLWLVVRVPNIDTTLPEIRVSLR